MLELIYKSLAASYNADTAIIQSCWNEIYKKYSGSKRHYHNLHHLENMYEQLLTVKDKIEHWETILFSLFYHDIIYNSMRSDNEEQSALVAKEKMKALFVPDKIIANCVEQIIATKKHHHAVDSDTNYFTDADLSILGQPWNLYQIYFEQVRKEYSFYPNIVYKPGRKKVLEHFLAMPAIFKTDFFIDKYEVQAKQNIIHEIALLNG